MDFSKIVELLLAYWQPAVGVLLFAYFLFREWKDNKLTRIVDLVVAWLKEYAADELQDVTREEADKAAAIFYERYVLGTFLAKVVTLTMFQTGVWAALCKLRDAYVVAWFNMSEDCLPLLPADYMSEDCLPLLPADYMHE